MSAAALMERLRRDHARDAFDCGADELNRFLHRHALANQQAEAAQTCELVREQRRRSRKHTALSRLATVQTLRFTLFHRAALLLRPAGRSILRLAKNPATEDLFMRINRELSCAT